MWAPGGPRAILRDDCQDALLTLLRPRRKRQASRRRSRPLREQRPSRTVTPRGHIRRSRPRYISV